MNYSKMTYRRSKQHAREFAVNALGIEVIEHLCVDVDNDHRLLDAINRAKRMYAVRNASGMAQALAPAHTTNVANFGKPGAEVIRVVYGTLKWLRHEAFFPHDLYESGAAWAQASRCYAAALLGLVDDRDALSNPGDVDRWGEFEVPLPPQPMRGALYGPSHP